MNKQILIISALASMASIFSATAPKAGDRKIQPEKVIFCWDIHDTLLKQNKNERFHATVSRDLHLAYLPEAHTTYKKLLDTFGFCAGEHMENACQKMAQEYLDKAAHSHKNGNKKLAKKHRKTAKRLLKLIKSFHTFELSYEYQDGIHELLDALKSNGYTRHHVASNIAERHFDMVKKKFPILFNDSLIKDGVILDVHNAPHIKKPHKDYFSKLSNTINPNGDYTLVFIDDKQKNVDAARSSGLVSFQMTSVGNLMDELGKYGINLTKQSPKSAPALNKKDPAKIPTVRIA